MDQNLGSSPYISDGWMKRFTDFRSWSFLWDELSSKFEGWCAWARVQIIKCLEGWVKCLVPDDITCLIRFFSYLIRYHVPKFNQFNIRTSLSMHKQNIGLVVTMRSVGGTNRYKFHSEHLDDNVEGRKVLPNKFVVQAQQQNS
jgi:hypothetical protein